MDNVIWIIIAAAVIIALAGILLFIGADSLTDIQSDADDISGQDRPDDWESYANIPDFRLGDSYFLDNVRLATSEISHG